MNTPDIEALKATARREFEADLAELRRNYEAQLKAIDWLTAQQNGEAPKGAPLGPTTGFDLRARIEALLPSKRVFTRPEIQKLAGEAYPDSAARLSRVGVSRALSQLIKDGVVEVARSGKGGRATRYRRRVET